MPKLSIALSLILLAGALAIAVRRRTSSLGERLPWIYYLFFFSGFPALIYQIVWERALFALYGVNIESVTVVVTGFLLGLGLESLVGGYLSRIAGMPLLALFGTAELCTAAYGVVSLRLFHAVGVYTAGISLLGTTALSFMLLLIPTMLMGSTLPMLVAYSVRRSRNVGASLGLLYFVNTLGSATACFLAAAVVMALLGEFGSVVLGAAINATVGIGAIAINHSRSEASREPATAQSPRRDGRWRIPTDAQSGLGDNLCRSVGFYSASVRDLWYRLFSFWSGSGARVFALLLGAYLAGIAAGGLIAHDLTSDPASDRSKRQYLRLLACFVVLANLAGFVAAPAMGIAAQYFSASCVMLIIAFVAACWRQPSH